MQLLSKFNKGIKYLLCVIDLFSKYAFVVPLKDKKGISIVNAFQSVLNKSKRKPNKNFTMFLLKNSCKIMILLCIQRIMKESP